MRLYRSFFYYLFSFFGRWIFGDQRWKETQTDLHRIAQLERGVRGSKPRVWFHAASVGELESLWPLVQLAQVNGESDLIITVFSSSAWAHVHRLSRKLEHPPLFSGYSPVEGQWTQALLTVSPNLFVTAKYEAWPEIWNALGSAKIPLAIIGAKPRSSLIWAKRILKLLRGHLPQLLFFSFDRENESGLRAAFPQSAVFNGSDPRWDRVFSRSRLTPPRVKVLAAEYKDLPRPWGILGSAWPSDVAQFLRGTADRVPGTLWFVPHKIDLKSISEIEILIREAGWTPVRSSSPDAIRPAGKLAIIVDEMGFLAELYSVMDWAMVGGGFGSSVHSTIEPSIYGLPIIAGPRGQEKFDEIAILTKQEQMTILDKGSEHSLTQWIIDITLAPDLAARKAAWRQQNLRHVDASARTWEILNKRIADSVHAPVGV